MWLKIIKATRSYFHISHREAKGTIVLLALSFFILGATLFYRNYTPNTASEIKLVEHSISTIQESPSIITEHEIELISFDPNTFTDFESLGFPSFLSKRIINYRSKGGVFRIKTDLKKIYGFPDSLYTQLAPYILLPDVTEVKQNYNYPTAYPKTSSPKVIQPLVIVDISTADSSQLTTIKGIGPTLATRILKYRNALGGFHSTNQLKQVYGLNSPKADEIIKQCTINSVYLKQISLNTTSFKEMVHHPYLEYDEVKRIFDHKKTTGGYNQVEDLKRFNILADSTYNKILPYLKL